MFCSKMNCKDRKESSYNTTEYLKRLKKKAK